MSEELLNTALPQGLQHSIFSRLRKNRLVRWAMNVLAVLILIALFAPLLANEKPLYIQYRSANYFPAFWDLNPFADNNFYEVKLPNGGLEKLQLDITDWKKLEYKKVLWCPVPYSPGKSDYTNSGFVSPFGRQKFQNTEEMPIRFRHLLGTGVRGEDVLAGLIHGTRISLAVGIISMFIASLIGLLLGALAGYFGDHDYHTSKALLFCVLIGIPLGFFYGFYARGFQLQDSLAISIIEGVFQLLISAFYFILIVFLFVKLGKLIVSIGFGKKLISIPLDSIISRSIEIIISLPSFILILSIAAITKPSIFNLIFIIAFTSWTGIARLTRAEILRIKKLDYIQAAKALGYSQKRIILKHALVNGISPALVAIAFGVASTILIESSLSFLGIGLPIDTVTWGSMLSEGRTQFSAWWMTLFPGLAIFITITVYNLLGDGLRETR